MQNVPILFGRNSELLKSLRNSPDVKIMLEQLERTDHHPFFALLVWLGYTEIAVDISLTIDFFGRIKLSISDLVDFCCMYLVRSERSNVHVKIPQCFRDFIEDGRGSPLSGAFPLVKTGNQWKTLENLMHCFLWSLMKMSEITSSTNICLGDICPALKPTYAGELCFSSDSKSNRVFNDIGKITKINAESRYSNMMKRVGKGETVIVSFFEKSHSPDHLLVFNLNELTLVGIQDKLYRIKKWATKKLLKEEVEKFKLCSSHCKPKKSVFILLAPFLDGELCAQDGHLLTFANYEFIPDSMQVVILSLKTGAANFIFSESFAFDVIDSVDIS